jgi:hypothetical protein
VGVVHFARGDPGVAQILLGPDDEADLALMQRVESGEIEIAAIDNNDRPGGPLDHIEDIDVVHFARGDVHEYRDGAAQIDDGVGFDGCLGGTKVRPGKECQAQIDRGGIHGIQGFLESQAGLFALMQFDRYGNQAMAKGFEQLPLAPLVGIGQGGARDLAANADVIELGAMGIEARHQIAQAFAPSQLGVSDAQEMIPSREVFDAVVRCEAIHQVFEVGEGNEVQQLSENRTTVIHEAASFAWENGKDTGQQPLAFSNRRNPNSPRNPRQSWLSFKSA